MKEKIKWMSLMLAAMFLVTACSNSSGNKETGNSEDGKTNTARPRMPEITQANRRTR